LKTELQAANEQKQNNFVASKAHFRW